MLKRFVTIEATSMDQLAKTLSQPEFAGYKLVWVEKLSKWTALLERETSEL